MGAVGLVGLALGIAAIVLNKRNPETAGGFGMALAGIITSVLAFIVVLTFHLWLVSVVDEVKEETDRPMWTATQSTSDDDKTTDADDESTAASGNEASEPDDETKTATRTLSDDQIVVELNSFALTGPDYSGEPTGMLTFTITNNSDENYDLITLDVTAFQDGTSLDDFPIFKNDPEGYDSNSRWVTIQPGATGTVTVAYKLNNETSPVEIEVEDLFNFSGKDAITQTFEIQ